MGVAFGIAAQGRNGEVVFNHVADLEVPLALRKAVEKAYSQTCEAADTTAQSAVTAGRWVGRQTTDELSRFGKELSQFGSQNLEQQLDPADRSAIMEYLRNTARKRQGIEDMSDAPVVEGSSSYGITVSNGNVNNALKGVGLGAYLPLEGSTGVFLYLDDKSNELRGFGASIKWNLPVQ